MVGKETGLLSLILGSGEGKKRIKGEERKKITDVDVFMLLKTFIVGIDADRRKL